MKRKETIGRAIHGMGLGGLRMFAVCTVAEAGETSRLVGSDNAFRS
ncbi:hypothetical protein [Paludibacterium paludis]|nr:hypothetical protein [Paludibacterium paludis]